MTPVVDVDLVGADVLGDAAGLAGRHLGLADRVEQRRLAVVDVAHDRHDRRARLEVLVGVVELRLGVDLVGGVDDLDLLVELVREHLDRVVGQRLGERRHLAQLHQLLDHLGHGDAEVLGDVLDRRARVDLDDVGLEDRDVLRDRLRVRAAPAPSAAPRRAPLRAAAGTAARAAGTPPGPPERRAACESITTRRTPPEAPGARSPWSEERVGRRGPPPLLPSPAGGWPLSSPRFGSAFGSSLRGFTPSGGRAPRSRMPRSPGGRSCVRCGCFGLAPFALGFFLPVSAASASASSTADAVAFTAMPAAFSRFITSAVGMLYCLASSWTRFLAM